MSALYASGDAWVGAGVRSMETGLEELFGGGPRRIVACAYSLGEGAFDLPGRLLGLALDAGAEVVLLVDRYADQPRAVTRRLDALAMANAGLLLYSYDGPDRRRMHAKVVVRDERRALIGSANWSGNGFLHNHEMAVMVDGEAARRAADMIVRRATGAEGRRCG